MSSAIWKSAFSYANDATEAAEECLAALSPPYDPTVCFLFVSENFSSSYESIFQTLQSALGECVFLGGSASGLVGRGQESEFESGLSLLCGWLPNVDVVPFYLEKVPSLDDPPEAWRKLIAEDVEELKGLVLLADPFTFDAESILAGVDFAYPDIPKVGGLVSGCQLPGQAALFCGDRIVHSGCVGLAFAGEIEMSPAVCQGCQGFGKQYVITDCHQHLLRELSGEPAAEALGKMIADLTPEQRRAYLQNAIFIGLGAGRPKLEYGPGDFLVRQVMGIDDKSRGLVVGTSVRKGQTIQFHLRNRATSHFDIESVLTKSIANLPGKPEAGLMFSCLGRGEGLYGESGHDSKTFQKIGGDLPLSGFFCNGEIGPVGGETSLHGFTSSFVIFSQPN